MLALKLFLHIVTGAAALIVTTIEYLVPPERETLIRRLRFAAIATIVGGLLLGGIVIVVDHHASAEESAGSNSEFTVLRGASQKTAALLTGGDGFPYVNVVDGMVILINEGRTPLYDISGRMWDPANYARAMTSDEFWQLERNVVHFSVPSMAPRSVLAVAQMQPPSRNTTYQVTFIARNGTFTEQLGFATVGKRVVNAYRVFRDPVTSTSQPLLQRMDPAFPRDAQGQPRWE